MCGGGDREGSVGGEVERWMAVGSLLSLEVGGTVVEGRRVSGYSASKREIIPERVESRKRRRSIEEDPRSVNGSNGWKVGLEKERGGMVGRTVIHVVAGAGFLGQGRLQA